MKNIFKFFSVFLLLVTISTLCGCPASPDTTAQENTPATNKETSTKVLITGIQPLQSGMTIGVGEVKTFYFQKVPSNATYPLTCKVVMGNDFVSVNNTSDSQITLSGISIGKGKIRVFNEECGIYATYDFQVTKSTGTNSDAKGSGTINQYFWGKWQRMDNGQYYDIDDSKITYKEIPYGATSSTETRLEVPSLGVFEKQSDRVMINGSIPYFRKGGTNLEYKMKLVGFEDTLSRAAASVFKGEAKSEKIPSFRSTGTPDEDNVITFTAPVADDVQTVTITKDDTKVAVIPGITVETNGSNMGTIPISYKGTYSLKVTGTIPESEKKDGYLFGDNNTWYNMILTIKNVGDTESAPSSCRIAPTDNNVTVEIVSGNCIISTLDPGNSKTIGLRIKCGELTEPYIDTGINVTIENENRQTWQDFVPLRFFKGMVPLTVAAQSTEQNSEAVLNGFIIYPDGNSQFFKVPDRSSKTIFVPSFGKDKPYTLAFSGATIKSELSSSTEMLYAVDFGTLAKPAIDDSTSKFLDYVRFGESNNTEAEATAVDSTFQAYLKKGDIDFYNISLDSTTMVYTDYDKEFTVSYSSQYGSSPSSKKVKFGYSLTSSDLPTLSYGGYEFEGWYSGTQKIEEGYYVTENLQLVAKWKLPTYTASNISSLKVPATSVDYTIKLTGEITETTLSTVVTKTKNASCYVILDLTETTGLKAINESGTSSSSSVFYNYARLKEIKLPDSVKTIGNYAFYYCSNLEAITFKTSVNKIGNYAFSNSGLKSIELPVSVSSVGPYAFSNC